MYNFQLSDEKRRFAEAARKFAEKEIKPYNDKFDDEWETHQQMSKVLKKAGVPHAIEWDKLQTIQQ